MRELCSWVLGLDMVHKVLEAIQEGNHGDIEAAVME
jgi:hypothetical protein